MYIAGNNPKNCLLVLTSTHYKMMVQFYKNSSKFKFQENFTLCMMVIVLFKESQSTVKFKEVSIMSFYIYRTVLTLRCIPSVGLGTTCGAVRGREQTWGSGWRAQDRLGDWPLWPGPWAWPDESPSDWEPRGASCLELDKESHIV